MSDGVKRSAAERFGRFVATHLKDGISVDSLVATNKAILSRFLPGVIALSLHAVFVYFVGHFLILHALLTPVLSFVKQKHGLWKFKDISSLRSELTLCLFAVSAMWHVFSWPGVLRPFNWAFTLRPQINVKPQMTMVAKRSQSEITCRERADVVSHSCRSKSLGNLSEVCNTEVDFGLDVKVRDGITDKFWNGLERVSDTLSLASALDFSSFKTDSTKYSQSNVDESEFEFDRAELEQLDLDTIDEDASDFSFINQSALPGDQTILGGGKPEQKNDEAKKTEKAEDEKSEALA